MHSKKTELLSEVATYYAKKLAEHGETPNGVDWNGEESQTTRFEQLCKVIDPIESAFSVNDLGCGYGALLDYLRGKHPAGTYLGIDISQEMISSAEQRHAAATQARFITSAEPDQQADYGVASGIFNVRLGRADAEWFDYLQATLDVLDRTSSLGFAFNCLTSYSDEDKIRTPTRTRNATISSTLTRVVYLVYARNAIHARSPCFMTMGFMSSQFW